MTTTDKPTRSASSPSPQRLRQLLTQQGLTVSELADRAGVNHEALSGWLSGSRIPRLPTVGRTAAALGVEAAHLLDGADHDGRRLELALARRGLTIREAARRAGVHENTLAAWISGRVGQPSDDALRRLARALDVPATALGAKPEDIAPPPPPEPARPYRAAPKAQTSSTLRRLLAAHGWSTRQLADAIGASHGAVGNWVSGRHGIRPDLIGRVAAALGVDLEDVDPSLADATPLTRTLASKGLTLTAVAARTGLSTNSIGAWAGGRERPTAAQAAALAAVLGAEPDDLFPAVPVVSEAAAGQPTARGLDAVLDLPATGDPGWQDQAVCADPAHDPEAWWPTSELDPAAEARQGCAACPVAGDCRDAFLADPAQHRYGADGIWAGHRGRDLLRAHRHRTATRTPHAAGQMRRPSAQGRSR